MVPENKIIWDAITNSAKKRFDYASFNKEFPFVSDAIILKIVVDLASSKNKDTITTQVYDEVFTTTGEYWNTNQINLFISDKDEVFKREIFAVKRAGNMMYEGSEPEDIYYEISKFILTN
jgi:hypothetical protein